MAKLKGFWSYVHADDSTESGRIVRLARDVKAQYEMITGDSINLFLDRESIEWGQDWRERIDSSLGSIAFFIPVLTPRYFMSAECRRELQFFIRTATNLGVRDLILPLLYVDVVQIHDTSNKDDLVTLVRTFQWEDWRDLRFSDTDSEAYRRGIAKLAKRLSEANAQLVEGGSAKPLSEPKVAQIDESDDTPGVLDLLANMEESLPKVSETLQSIAGCTAQIGEIMSAGSEKVRRADSQGKGFGARILIARKMAGELAEPVDQMQALTNSYASELYDVDQGTRVIIELASRELDQAPEGRKEICTFFAQVKNLASNASDALVSVQELIDGSGPIEAISRDLRPVLKRHRQALTAMVEATQVMNEWVKLIDMSGIDCEA